MEFIRKKTGKEIGKEAIAYTEKSGFPCLQFPLLEQTGIVEHMFSTRLGGVSKGVCATANFGFSRGDDPEDVLENYRRAAKAMVSNVEQLVCSDQTHTTNIRIVTKEDGGKGVVRKKDYSDIDGLITNVPGVVLCTFYADCVPLFLVDSVNKAIGLSHSGWRGTVARMGKVTLEAMKREYGTNPENVIAAIGPSICGDCYEIGEEVADEFIRAFSGKESIILKRKENGKYLLDLWKANELVLTEAGIKTENLAVTDICTCCNPELLFSHRATQGKRGNLAAFMKLKEY